LSQKVIGGKAKIGQNKRWGLQARRESLEWQRQGGKLTNARSPRDRQPVSWPRKIQKEKIRSKRDGRRAISAKASNVWPKHSAQHKTDKRDRCLHKPESTGKAERKRKLRKIEVVRARVQFGDNLVDRG